MDYAIGSPPPDGPQNKGHIIIGIDCMVFAISWTMVILRLATRTWITRNLGWDDATILLAAMTNSVGMGFYATMVLYGLGQHKYYLSNYSFKEFLKYDYLDWIQAFTTLAVSKISICLLLLRLSKFSRLKAILYGLIAFMIVTHVPLTFMFIFQCSPISKYWNHAIGGRCWSKQMITRILIAQGVFSIITDFVGAAIPIMLLWHIQLQTRHKVGIWLLMGFGIVTGITCIVRTSFTSDIQSSDLSWDAVAVSLAKCIEVNFGIKAACLPLMKPLLTYLRSYLFGEIVDLTHNSRHQQSDLSPASQLSGPWRRIRGSISALNPFWAGRRPSRSQESPDEEPKESRDSGWKRTYTRRKPLPRLPSAAVTTEKGQSQNGQQTQAGADDGVGLPIQGIRKTTNFGVENAIPDAESKRTSRAWMEVLL